MTSKISDIVAALQAFRRGELEPASILRRILQYDQWWVPLSEGGEPELRTDGSQCWLAAYPEEIEGSAALFSGTELVRLARDGAASSALGGVILDPEEEHAISFEASKLADLERWATALALEEALAVPAPGQGELLLGARWVVLNRADGQPAVVRRGDLLLVPVFTAEDAVARYLATDPTLASGTDLGYAQGEALFRALSSRADYDGVAFFGPQGGIAPELAVVGPGYLADLLTGLDSRPGADVLPSRTVAEIHLWLDLAGVPRSDRRHVVEQRDTGMCAVYDVPMPGRGRTRVAFALGAATPDPEDLGEGPSRILCAGLLADALRTRVLGLPEQTARDVGPSDRANAAFAARLAWELEKLLEGEEQLPRSTVRTALGARLLRERPETGTRSVILSQRQRAEALAGTV